MRVHSLINKINFEQQNKGIYYIAASVLLENRQLVKFIRNHLRDCSGIFSISSLVRISMTSFPAFATAFARLFVQSCQISVGKGERIEASIDS